MKRNQKKTTPTVFVCSLIAGVVFLTGCYLKQKPPGSFLINQNASGKQDVLGKHWDRFFADVKKVDSRAKASYDMGVYFQKRKKHHLALQEFQRAVQFDSTDAKTFNAMGISYDNTGDHDQAIRCYEMAIKLDPAMAAAYNNLGYSKMLNEDNDGAMLAYQKAIELDDTNPRYRNNLDSLYARTSRSDQASDQLKAPDNTLAAEQKLDKLLGISAHEENQGERLTVSELLKNTPDRSSFIESPKEDVMPITQKEASGIKAANTGDIYKNDPGKLNLNNEKNTVVYVVYENESEQAEAEGDNKVFADDEAFGRRETAENDHKTGTTPANNEKEVADLLLYAVNINTKSQVLTLYEYDHVSGLIDSEMAGGPEAPTMNHPAIVEVVFREEPTQTDKLKILEKSNRAITSSHRNSLADGGENQLKYEHIKIIEVGANQDDNRHMLLTELKIAEKKNGKLHGDIEVANGNGGSGAARRLANYLHSKGFKISKVSNARSFDHLSTKVLYRTKDMDYLFPLLNELPLMVEDADLIENDKMQTSMRIIIGKDLTANR